MIQLAKKHQFSVQEGRAHQAQWAANFGFEGPMSVCTKVALHE